MLLRMQAAKDAGYDLTLRYVALANADLNLDRIEARAAKGGHWIESETVRRRVAGSMENLPAAIGIADRAFLLDNSGATYRQVLKIEHGRITYEAPDLPLWLARQMPRIMAELERAAQQGRLAPPLPRE